MFLGADRVDAHALDVRVVVEPRVARRPDAPTSGACAREPIDCLRGALEAADRALVLLRLLVHRCGPERGDKLHSWQLGARAVLHSGTLFREFW